MIINKLVASKVYGYIDYNISFNEDISFLVGANGSGKTTALKLMNALVNPIFKDLIQIPYKHIALELVENKQSITISSEQVEDNKVIRISTSDESLTLPSYSSSEFGYYSHRSDKLNELVEEINRKYADHPVIQKISQIQSPIFLGLDRRRESTGVRSRDEFFLERDLMFQENSKRAVRARRLIRGSIGASLMESEVLVHNAYRRMRQIEERQAEQLRDSILLSAFQYANLGPEELKPDMNSWKEKAGLLERQKEIKEALTKIGVKDSRLSSEVDKFFNAITELIEQQLSVEEGFTIEWLLNKAQIERMSKIVDIIDDHKSKIDKLYEPINGFLDTVNDFYQDSNKSLVIDTVGQLLVKRPDGNDCSIEGLSSGERQLLVIFAHSYFNRYKQKNSVFIIDEPELSLHLRWQEKFAETVFSISPRSQFILATHSPEIIGENVTKAVECR